MGWELVFHYLDDIIHIFSLRFAHMIQQKAKDYIKLTDLLGVPRNDSKDAVGQVVPVFGYIIDSLLFEMRIPQGKLETILQLVDLHLSKRGATLHEIQVLAGYLSWASPAIQLGWVFCRNVWNFQTQFNIERPRQHLTVPADVRIDLQWWSDTIEYNNGTRFFNDPARIVFHLFTDACKVGMGGFYYAGGSSTWKDNLHLTSDDQAYTEIIPEEDKMDPFDINVFEVRAVLRALERWGHLWEHQKLFIFTDNTPTFRGIEKGSLKSSANDDLRKVMCAAARFDIILVPQWIEGRSNELADALSRFDSTTIANWRPNWQISAMTSSTSPHPQKNGSRS